MIWILGTLLIISMGVAAAAIVNQMELRRAQRELRRVKAKLVEGER